MSDMKSYEITDENNIPKELLEHIKNGKAIYCKSAIGWIDVTDDFNGFRCGVIYGIKT